MACVGGERWDALLAALAEHLAMDSVKRRSDARCALMK
jgi:hypothetical protein